MAHTTGFDTDTTLEKVRESDTEKHSPRELVVCSNCGHVLADEADAMARNGKVVHTKTNPHGFVHTFRCFSEALGCSIVGKPERADSWFPQYTWRYLFCVECNSHVGWLFEGLDYFYSLLVNNTRTAKIDP